MLDRELLALIFSFAQEHTIRYALIKVCRDFRNALELVPSIDNDLGWLVNTDIII